MVITHGGLAARARAAAPGKVVVPFQVFLGDPAVTKVVKAIEKGEEIRG